MENHDPIRHDERNISAVSLRPLIRAPFFRMSQKPPTSENPPPAFRPPDFLLPQSENAAMRRRFGEPEIFLSWNGEVYGPATAAEVVAGVRSSSFETGALYWFEGQKEWRPVAEFPGIAPTLSAKRPTQTPAEDAADAPPPPADPSHDKPVRRRKKHSHHKRPAAPPIPKNQSNLRGIGIIIIFALLAVGLTTGIILLLHTLMRG